MDNGQRRPWARCLWRGIGAAWVLSAGVAVMAQGFPGRPVTLVIPFAAGGPTDVVARQLAIPMGRQLGQPVVVENVVGAGGTLGAAKVAQAAPTGHTVLLHHMGMATAPALYKKLSFDPVKDFEPIAQVLDVPMLLLARKGLPASDLPELQAYLRQHKDQVSLAHAGLGAVSHLCGMLITSALGISLTTIPYKGTAPAMNDLMGGQVDLLCDQTTGAVPFVRDGRVKAIGVATARRLSALPLVPTLDEQGLKGLEVKVWHGLYAPRGTPPEVVARLGEALRTALRDPQVTQRLAELNAEIPEADKLNPEGLRRHLAAEIAKWGPLIRKAGVYAD